MSPPGGLPRGAAPEPGWTWIHGASAGEHRVVAALAPLLGPELWRTRFSWRTPVPGAFPAPLDLPVLFPRWLDRARPGRLLLVEAELWPGWLWHCRRRGIPVAVLNARDSRGTARWRRLPPLWRWLTRGVLFFDQATWGDLKLAAPPPPPAFRLPRASVIGASTRPGDEEALLAAWRGLDAPRPLLVLAPRHRERWEELRAWLSGTGHRWVGRRDGLEGLAEAEILLLDSQGELASLISQAAAVFVGGTFDPTLGGHSPAEARAAGVPVVGGPERWANPAAWEGEGCLLAEDPAALGPALRAALATPRPPPPPGPDLAALIAALPAPRPPPETPARPWLWPLVPLVHALGRLRPAWWGRPERAPVPVVSVGALAAGGAGKTPAVAWLAARLTERLGPGAVWILGRGYGRRREGPAVRRGLPGGEGDASLLGDELEMLRRRGFPVISAPDRRAGAARAAAEGARLVLLDDGFQHRRLHRDLDIVCVDADWPAARGPIPVGYRREPWSGLRRAHWIWESQAGREPLVLPVGQDLPRVRARARPVGWLRRGALLPLSAVQGEVDVAAGIARPERFFCALLRLGLTIRSLTVARDHRAPVHPPGAVLTEKDAARLPPEADVHALRIELEVEGAEPLLERILRLVEGA